MMRTSKSQQLEILRPLGTLDAKRFDARLEAAGVPQRLIERGAITADEADRFVAGGFQALSDAARTSGQEAVLDATDPEALAPKLTGMQAFMTKVGFGPQRQATNQVEEAAFGLELAATRLKQERLASSYSSAMDLFETINQAATDLDAALDDQVLGRASAQSVDALADGLRAVHGVYSMLSTMTPPARIFSSDIELVQRGLTNIPDILNRAAELLDLGRDYQIRRCAE